MAPAILLVVVFCLVPIQSLAGTLHGEDELRNVTNTVMEDLKRGETVAALARMKQYALIAESEFETNISEAASQRDHFRARYGNPTSFEFVHQGKMSDSMIKVTYVEKSGAGRLAWMFYFSRVPDGWALNSVYARY
jgi:O-phosphoseryl-tRNA(Cys) synthetase